MKPTLVILAAGKGTRLAPLTSTTPKPLIKIAGKPILEWNLENASMYTSGVYMVVGYLSEQIQAYFGSSFHGLPIKYITQKKLNGTAAALNLAKDVSSKKIIVINGDDIYSKKLFKKTAENRDFIAGKYQEDCSSVGAIKLDNGKLVEIVEKPKKFVSIMANTGFYFVDKEIFDYFPKVKPSKRGEIEITDLVSLYARDHDVKVIRTDDGWIQISYPWQILDATQTILTSIKKSKILGKMEKGATIKGKLILGKNSVIKSGTYLEGNFYIGENCTIGPNCYLKDFASIGNNCFVGNGSEVVRSVVGDDVSLRHLVYLGDSIVGNHVNFGAGTKVANLRHDFKNIRVKINGKFMDTGKNKFGVIIGDSVKLGINTLIYPGVKISTYKTTLPGEIVKKDLL